RRKPALNWLSGEEVCASGSEFRTWVTANQHAFEVGDGRGRCPERRPLGQWWGHWLFSTWIQSQSQDVVLSADLKSTATHISSSGLATLPRAAARTRSGSPSLP